MILSDTTLLTVLVFVIAVLYSAVGQAGATGYLAAMGLVGMAPVVMKPTALALNLLVASVATLRFARAGHFKWTTFYPFAVLGVPFSFIGGMINVPGHLYYPLVGTLLLLAGAQLAISRNHAMAEPAVDASPPFWWALLSGAVVGLISGTTGTGGGIFLAPIILIMGWVDVRRTAAVVAAYNLLNSGAALSGAWSGVAIFPEALPIWLVIAAVGAFVGTALSSRLSANALRLMLATILAIAGTKMLFG